ncbi:putative capsular polysaccharide synthesis family protein [Fodinibius saliphilus]|uniref:putative capsular polysaccharide synthesis family protein n=1 Tax=Fodinibius saliphilus TaxID=1920650 RepID=UPI00148632A7|nr:putative capsular polysaccharide synthesis family protein [Fodinibius saliphilus]
MPHQFLYLKHRLFEFFGREPIIVYTMGKVGSSTVFHTFQKQYYLPLVYHVHHLTDRSYQRAVDRYQKNNLPISPKINLITFFKGNSSHMSASCILKKDQIINSNRKWNVITLVRDPFSTYLSHIFQNPQIIRPFLLDDDGILVKEKVEDHIEKVFSGPNPEKDFITNWFDEEFLKVTGIDIYEYPFDHEKGYVLIEGEQFNIAIIALESLDSNLAPVFKQLFKSNKDVSIERKNIRSKNDKSGFYKLLKQNIRVSREGLKEFYSTKYAKHFFSEEFRNKMINRWSKNEYA